MALPFTYQTACLSNYKREDLRKIIKNHLDYTRSNLYPHGWAHCNGVRYRVPGDLVRT